MRHLGYATPISEVELERLEEAVHGVAIWRLHADDREHARVPPGIDDLSVRAQRASADVDISAGVSHELEVGKVVVSLRVPISSLARISTIALASHQRKSSARGAHFLEVRALMRLSPQGNSFAVRWRALINHCASGTPATKGWSRSLTKVIGLAVTRFLTGFPVLA